jgi:hypothetical protein
LGCGFGKRIVVVVDIELVPPVSTRHVTGITDIDVQPAVVVYVYEDYTGAPHAVLHDAGSFCNVLKFEISFIDVELIFGLISRKENIWQAVIIDIPDGYAAAIIKIPEQETVFQLTVDDLVIKIHAGIFDEIKQSRFAFLQSAGSGAKKEE